MTIQYGPEGQYKQAVGTQLRVTTTVYERWPLNKGENDINQEGKKIEALKTDLYVIIQVRL